jgi:neutral ceramidase
MVSRTITTALSAAMAAALAVAPAGAQSAGLRAAVVKVDITPTTPKYLLGYGARQSIGVHDHIFTRVVALDDGTTQFFLASSDVCEFSPSVYEEFVAQLKKETGIDRLQVWWGTTHTHSAPEIGMPSVADLTMPERHNHPADTEYTAFVEKSLIDAIKEARTKLEPTRLVVGTGYSAANINRRATDAQGRSQLGLNPDGPADRQINLLRLERPDGSPIALVFNYPIHGTSMAATNLLISGDVPGVVAQYVEEKIGAPTLFINGAAGNLAPIYETRASVEAAHLTQFYSLLGDRIIAANSAMKAPVSDVHLRLSERIVETPRRHGYGWEEALSSYLMQAAPGEDGIIRLPVRFLIINDDIAIWSVPVELFCEISMDVRARSPYEHTFYFGYSDGSFGYLPTKQAFAEGGYEPRTGPFTDSVETDLKNVVIPYLQGHGH